MQTLRLADLDLYYEDVGVSMGGMIGLQLAADKPEAVRSLIAVNTMPEVFVRTLKQRWMFWQRMAIVRLFGMRTWARFLAPRFFPGDEHAELRRAFVERWSVGWCSQHSPPGR